MSYLTSTSLLKDIAQLRAITNAPNIKRSFPVSGIPPVAMNALITAKGNENIVCENLIKLKMVESFVNIFRVDSVLLSIYLWFCTIFPILDVFAFYV